MCFWLPEAERSRAGGNPPQGRRGCAGRSRGRAARHRLHRGARKARGCGHRGRGRASDSRRGGSLRLAPGCGAPRGQEGVLPRRAGGANGHGGAQGCGAAMLVVGGGHGWGWRGAAAAGAAAGRDWIARTARNKPVLTTPPSLPHEELAGLTASRGLKLPMKIIWETTYGVFFLPVAE